MKRLFKRWLGIDKLATDFRLDEQFRQLEELRKRVKELESEAILYGGSMPMPRGVKEHVWALIEYLNLRPDETFEVTPSIVEEKTERHFRLVPRSSPEPAKEDFISRPERYGKFNTKR